MEKVSIFEKIDNYFASKKPNEANLIFLFLGALIGFVVYMYVFPVSEEYLETSMANESEISMKLNNEQAYIDSVSGGIGDEQYEIKLKQSENNNRKKQLDKAINTNIFIDNKLKELSYLLFNEQNWANFIDELAFLSAENDVLIQKIENEFFEPTIQKIEHVLELTLQVDGTFNNILKLINSVEENKLVVDVYDLNITRDKNLNGTIKIAVWGMRY